MRALVVVALVGCRAPDTCDTLADRPAPDGRGGNVLFLLLDDVGIQDVSGYGMADDAPSTPNLDALAASGLRFDRFYASPSCSPTRAAILTGRHPSRTGVGRWIDPPFDASLPADELTIPEMLRLAPDHWSTALIGKWHLSGLDHPHPENDPQLQGFDHFRGILANAQMSIEHDGVQRSYRHWERIVDGELSWDDEWITTVQVDDALDILPTLSEPWFVEVAFTAAHEPWAFPPGPVDTTSPYDAVIEDLDTQIGRLLARVSLDDTTVFALSDNGTPDTQTAPPYDPQRAKESVFEGGVRVPFFAAGRAVSARGTSDALVEAEDLFPTVADLAGVDVDALENPIDGRSLLPWLDGDEGPARDCVMVEQFREEEGPDLDERAILDRDWELVRDAHGERLFRLGPTPADEGRDVSDDPDNADELHDLRGELRAYDRSTGRR